MCDLSGLWHVKSSLLDTIKPVSSKFTMTQLDKIVLILHGKYDCIDDMRLFTKLVGHNMIIETVHDNMFVYTLSDTVYTLELPEYKPVRKVCPKCNGRGFIPEYAHVSNGVCFHCNGKG